MAEVKARSVDLSALYEKTDGQLLAGFNSVQELLSNRTQALPYLQELNKALLGVQPGPLPGTSAAEKAVAANLLLGQVLGKFEKESGFDPERAVMVGFASGADFRSLTAQGIHFYDVGARTTHGEMTHRIQWFIVMSAVTGGTYKQSARDLFANSMSEMYELPANTAGGKAYMWDWIVDRTSSITLDPKGPKPTTIEYDRASDAWTNPGDQGGPGPLSNDLVATDDKLEGIDKLGEIRRAQMAGNSDYNITLTAWFKVAVSLGVAEGNGLVDDPDTKRFTYFYLPTDAMQTILADWRDRAKPVVKGVRDWAKERLSPDSAEDFVTWLASAHQSASDQLAPLAKDNPKRWRMAQAMVNRYKALADTLAAAIKLTGADLEMARAGVLGACDLVDEALALQPVAADI